MPRTPHVIGLTSLSDIAKNNMANNVKGHGSLSTKLVEREDCSWLQWFDGRWCVTTQPKTTPAPL